MPRIAAILAGIGFLSIPMHLAAQTVDAPEALPDPSTIIVPDVVQPAGPGVREQGYKFYYFHNPDVSFADAYQDLEQCRGHLLTGGAVRLPAFVPWEDTQGNVGGARGKPALISPYGMVGGLLVAVIQPKLDRGIASNKMIRCMTMRGYVRYPIPETTWNALNDSDGRQALLKQAKLASGPKPHDEPVGQ